MTITSRARRTLGDETYVDEPYVLVRWRNVPKILYAEWRGFATSAEIRTTLKTVLRAIGERHVLHVVGDSRKAKVVSAEDEIWAKEVFLPEAAAAGLKRMATVTATSGMGKLQREQFFQQANVKGLDVRKFESVEAATTWALTGLAEP